MEILSGNDSLPDDGVGPPPGWEEISSLSKSQIDILIGIERVGAGLSLVAIIITSITFFAFKKMRTTPNVFLFCACVANAGACIASMIGYDGLQEGADSSLCQVQAFFFEWFMQSDPWWSFAMSLNVFLVFFCNVDPASFRKYTWIYCIVCFGGPLIPAVVLLSIRGDPRGPVYGNAALWCWVRAEWSMVRIYAYYIPIWICILLSLLIYIAVGYHVFHHRNQLKNITFASSEQPEKPDSDRKTIIIRDSAEERGLTHQPGIYCTTVTEVHVTASSARRESRDPLASPSPVHSRFAVGVCDPAWATTRPGFSHGHLSRQFETMCYSDNKKQEPKSFVERLRGLWHSLRSRFKRLDPVKLAYLRTSFIFGCAVLITWIPSSVNRLYSLSHHGRISFELSVASGCVLPLQGVWNTIIYFTTSWKTLWTELVAFKQRVSARFREPSNLEGSGPPRYRRDDFYPLYVPSVGPRGLVRYDRDEIELEDRYQ